MSLPILITVGMGVGPELAAALAHYYTKQTQHSRRIIFLGKKDTLTYLPQGTLEKGPLISAISFADDAQAAEINAIEFAARACLNNRAAAMVTGPINKKRLSERGFMFKGHTDFLGHLCGKKPVMAFTGGNLKVALVTTHIPLMSVSQCLSRTNITYTVRTAAYHLQHDLGIEQPKFAVCGLNPHAGEEGLLGKEELELIHPCCVELRSEGIDVVGAVSAETAFLMAQNQEVDMVIAMYHDQGLAPLKAVDFGRSVNWTLGLPIIRTSVDHGTAEHLVGTGKAKPDSFIAALDLALHICT